MSFIGTSMLHIICLAQSISFQRAQNSSLIMSKKVTLVGW